MTQTVMETVAGMLLTSDVEDLKVSVKDLTAKLEVANGKIETLENLVTTINAKLKVLHTKDQCTGSQIYSDADEKCIPCSSDPTYVYDAVVDTCQPCGLLSPAYYIGESGQCVKTKTCDLGFYESVAPTASADRKCAKVKTCDAAEYEFAAPTSATDRICKPWTVCPDGAYQTRSPGALWDRVCAKWTTCELGKTYESVAGSSRRDRICAPVTPCGEHSEVASGPTLKTNFVCKGKYKTCLEIKTNIPDAKSKVYSITPVDGMSFDVYCDMESGGGGWTLIQKVGAGPFAQLKPEVTAEEYRTMTIDPTVDVNPSLLLDPQSIQLNMSHLSRAKTNAIVGVSDSPMFFTRVDAIPYDIGNIGGYVQQKIDGRNFDGWRALRDGSYWGPESYWKALGTDAIQNMNPAYAEGFGDAFKLFKSKASSLPELDITTTEIQHTGDNTFGVWDRMVEKVSGEEVMYSRHGGLLNDGHFSGNQWLITLTPTEYRYMADSIRSAVIFVR